MAFSDEIVEIVYDKFDGRCRYCGKQLAFGNYGVIGRRGAWQIDHSVSRSNGGTDHLNNLFPACVSCNQDKGATNGASYLRRRANNGQPVLVQKKPSSWWPFG